ncbi:MAG: hypothetical protein H7328_12980 [Bdellovibrio sp.]|nr:hypothetical protein [Bdellovibrio sp.]
MSQRKLGSLNPKKSTPLKNSQLVLDVAVSCADLNAKIEAFDNQIIVLEKNILD